MDDGWSLAEQRECCQNVRVPWWFQYQDDLLTGLASSAPLSEVADMVEGPRAPISPPAILQPDGSSKVLSMFEMAWNTFGLWWKYILNKGPKHDPEKHVTLEEKVDYVDVDAESPTDFSPFPNQNLYLLDNWYWNHGAEKSQQSFQDLISIVSWPKFKPSDVADIPWHRIDAELTSNPLENGDNNGTEWMDEDAGWHRNPIHISVPFQNRTDSSGVEEFYFGDLYHHSLVEVIWGKLTSLEHHVWFHYEPFELWWTPSGSLSSTQVHSELYTSPAFLDTYQVVQEAPNEPGCNLEKVVFAMMFTSDVTLHTMFGDMKLWPGYLYCSNDSKYCCCCPSSNCCEHVAHFQTISTLQPGTLCQSWWWCIVGRSLMHSRTLLCSTMEDLAPVRYLWPIAGERRCTHSGISCWTTNSLLHGYMVLSLSVVMESVGIFILGSLHTLQII